MPVFPDVKSMIVVLPGVMSPRASASSIMLRAIRSLREPPGFCISSLQRIVACLDAAGTQRSSFTIGVLPTVSRYEHAGGRGAVSMIVDAT